MSNFFFICLALLVWSVFVQTLLQNSWCREVLCVLTKAPYLFYFSRLFPIFPCSTVLAFGGEGARMRESEKMNIGGISRLERFFFSGGPGGEKPERKCKINNRFSPLSRLSRNSAASIKTAILIFIQRYFFLLFAFIYLHSKKFL